LNDLTFVFGHKQILSFL